MKMNIIIETNWIDSEPLKVIEERYKSLVQSCGSVEGASFIGLYKPLNETWSWTSFMKVDTLEKWRSIDKEVQNFSLVVDKNVSQSMSRFYWGLDPRRKPPPIKDPESMKYLVMELCVCNPDLAMQEYYDQRCEQFTGFEGAGIMGLFSPLSEFWNWALIKVFDSLNRYLEAGLEFNRTYRSIPEITSVIQRVYERYEP